MKKKDFETGKMIYINLSYFDNILGPETLCTIPSEPADDIEDCVNSLLNISEFIDLKFFVYVSSEHFKTSNIYTKIPSDWARGGMEMLLISVILVDEPFTRLYLFEDVLEEIVKAITAINNAYMAFYFQRKERPEMSQIIAKKEEITNLLHTFLPKIQNIIETTKSVPLEGEVIETEEDLQDEFVILEKNESVLSAIQKIASNPRIVIGIVIEDNKPVGIIDETDVINHVLLAQKDPALISVEKVMTTDIISVDANEPIDDVIDRMITHGINAVPILKNEQFYGVFTISDAANHNKNVIDIIQENIQDLSEKKLEDIKKLKVKLWSYIRNISKNRKLMVLHKSS
ncbi:MAG: CBS domain-containing protein [Candidatus Helarchaeota archaeon]